MFEFNRGNYEQKSVQILEATRGLSSTNLEGTHLIECLRSQLKDVTEEMERLRKERDEARREFCQYIHQNGGVLPQHYAAARGWDCFSEKAEADSNNSLFRTTDGE